MWTQRDRSIKGRAEGELCEAKKHINRRTVATPELTESTVRRGRAGKVAAKPRGSLAETQKAARGSSAQPAIRR